MRRARCRLASSIRLSDFLTTGACALAFRAEGERPCFKPERFDEYDIVLTVLLASV